MQYLYETIFFSKKAKNLFSNEAIVASMLRFESALAAVQAKYGIIPGESARMIKKNCRVEEIDIDKLIDEAALSGNINIPLIRQLTSVVKKEDAEAAKWIHFGATSQDVIDTALMIRIKTATQLIAEDLDQLIDQVISLTKKHRNTIMVGRSFLQHARPITFGFKTAGWLDALMRSRDAVQTLLKESFVLQFGGAVGTLSSMKEKGSKLIKAMSEELGLNIPKKPWHTQRDRFAQIATAFGILVGNIGKIAKDISLLSQTEIAEVTESYAKGKGGSSAMPNKINPVGSISILANAARVPALVSTMLSCMVQDHERATGLWHAEWQTLIDIVQLTAGTVDKAVEIMGGLQINKKQMLHNLELTGGLIYAENLSLALASLIGKSEAHELIEQCCKDARAKNIHLRDFCINHPLISKNLEKAQIEKCFDPFLSLGLSDAFIDAVLNQKASIRN